VIRKSLEPFFVASRGGRVTSGDIVSVDSTGLSASKIRGSLFKPCTKTISESSRRWPPFIDIPSEFKVTESREYALLLITEANDEEVLFCFTADRGRFDEVDDLLNDDETEEAVM